MRGPQLCGPAAARPRRFRCVGPAAVRLPGLRTRVCHLGFAWPRSCAAPQLRGPAGLGCVGPAAVRPRVPSQFLVLLLLSGGRFRSSATVPLLGAKSVTPTTCWALGGPNVQPLQRFGTPGGEKCDPLLRFRPPGPQTCNPYSVLGPRGPKTRPLQRIGAPGPEQRDHCSVFGPRCLKNVTPTTLWGLGG